MRSTLVLSLAILALTPLTPAALADTFQFGFNGGGTSGSVTLTYGPATDARYSQAFEITGISGTFSDSNIGISDAAFTGLVPLTHATPEPGNLLTPADFSRFPVAAGTQHGSISFDNLFYPGGSPQTATSYPFHGGFLDIYGILATVGTSGEVVNIWSNGVEPGESLPDYGVQVATSATSLDAVEGGVAVTPEPGTLALLGTGLLGLFAKRRA